MHEDWLGTIFYGSDIAMLKLDRNAKLPVPRLFREGMYLEEELDVPFANWDVKRRIRPMGKTSTTSASPSISSVTVQSDDVCQMQREIISSKGWLCASEGVKETCDGARTDAFRARRFLFDVLGGAGSPLLVTDRPHGRLTGGLPKEDLLAAVKSFDAEDPKCQSCSVYTTVAYFREWMLRTIRGKSEPSRCLLSPEYEPRERIPFSWRSTRPQCTSQVKRRRRDRSRADGPRQSVYLCSPPDTYRVRRRVKRRQLRRRKKDIESRSTSLQKEKQNQRGIPKQGWIV